MRLTWSKYFLAMCDAVALRSLDKNTQIGCVITDTSNRIRSTGYNSLPSGVNDSFWPKGREDKLYFVVEKNGDKHISDTDPTRYISGNEDKPEVSTIDKYTCMVHAEVNAIVKAACDLTGCTLYCNYAPCSSCACSIITAGIKKVVAGKKYPGANWEKSFAITVELFNQAGIELLIMEDLDKSSISGKGDTK